MNEEVLDFLKILQTPKTEFQLEMVHLTGKVQNPNTVIHGRTAFEHAIEAIADIR